MEHDTGNGKRRSYWVAGLVIGVGLVGAGAALICEPRLEQKLREQALRALKTSGHDWGKVKISGREATLLGSAPSRKAVELAREAVLKVRGIRLVRTDKVQVAKLSPPTVRPRDVSRAPLVLSGTWKQAPGVNLAVELAGKRYVLGKSPELKAEGDGWTLRLEEPPADGTYDVVVIVTENGTEVRDTTRDELHVDTTPPAAPAFSSASKADGHWLLTGTWPEGDATKLVVIVDGKAYELGKAAELTSDGKGNWRLKLPAGSLKDGPHDVRIVVADAAGHKASAEKPRAFVVDTTPPAAPAFSSASKADGHWLLTGTWPEGDATKLVVIVDGKAYELGKAAELTSDGKGNWRLKLPAGSLKDGPHDVRIVVADAAGHEASAEKPRAFVVDTTPPPSPTVDSHLANNPRTVISGSWPSTQATTLEVEVAGKTYRLGETDALKVDGDHWKLHPDAPLPEGAHAVVVRTMDAAGNKAEAKGQVIIDTTPPQAPSLTAITVKEGEKAVLTGALPPDVAGMRITIHGDSYELGAEGSPLMRDNGNWKVVLPEPLPVGAHDALVEAVDEAGNAVRATFPSAVVVKAEPKPEPKPEPEPTAKPLPQPEPELEEPKPEPVADAAQCQRDITAWLKDHPIRFTSDGDWLLPEGKEAVAGLAELMKKCPGLKFHIVGHTDSVGSRRRNKALSERRAATVKNALVDLGIASERLSVEGAGESRPLVSNRTRAGRAFNRRIEIIVISPVASGLGK